MTVAIIEAALKIISTINNLARVPGFATLTLTIDNFFLLLEVTNILLPLNYVLYIHHLMRFKKDQTKIQTLLDSSNEINTMTLAYTAKLSFKDQTTNIRA